MTGLRKAFIWMRRADRLAEMAVLVTLAFAWALPQPAWAAPGAWSPTGPLSMADRTSHTATLLPNGQVLVAGGYSVTIFDTAEVYDSAAGGFFSLDPVRMITRRSWHTATLLPTGQVLLAGGGE